MKVNIEFVHDVVGVAKAYISKGTNAHINEKLRGGQSRLQIQGSTTREPELCLADS